ncbi:MAG TPA: potassium/proton antiporter [Phycisphaerae bacterium]|nr:potassium/proton antiporter [Phycisphaerae bacterium]HRY70986.1 potassium/proton antiporter [Phycisphaerae bacterium]HSA29268.1 potassium/proton antiporter [Phycisphaerae bacterium]
MAEDSIFLGVAVLLLASVLASKASERLGVPALLMFLLIGMLAGSEGPGGIYFDDARTAKFLGTLALAYILFSGGLDTDWQSVRPVFRTGMILATAGVFLTAVLVAAFAVMRLGFSWLEGLLLGSVISSTDAAAVFAILRSRSVSLKGRLRPLLELESGSNDPMAVFLTATMVSLLKNPSATWWSAIPAFVQQMLVGTAVGLLFGRGIIYLINKIRLEYEGLYPVLTLACVLLVFGAADLLGGNGFLAVYMAGIILGNGDFLHKRSLMRFHGGLAWLMQIAMFLTLGLLVFPSRLIPVIGSGVMLCGFLMVVARPASVMLCLAGSRLTRREKLLTSWVGLRGSVPIVLATFPMMAGLSRADTIFNLVFFVVITSVLLQGKSLPLVARWLRLDRPLQRRPRTPLELERTEENARATMADVIVGPDSGAAGKRIIELGLPRGALIVLVNRDGEYFVPNGGTVLQPNDVAVVLGDEDAMKTAQRLFHPQENPAAE